MSFRHTSSIVKINRTTAAIVWTLGGTEDQFGLTGPQIFSFQHHARMQADGSLTVFDDGNNENPQQTRVLSFVLDQANHKVTSFSVLYTKPASQPPSGLMGSAVPLSGGRLFVGWGGLVFDGSRPRRYGDRQRRARLVAPVHDPWSVLVPGTARGRAVIRPPDLARSRPRCSPCSLQERGSRWP